MRFNCAAIFYLLQCVLFPGIVYAEDFSSNMSKSLGWYQESVRKSLFDFYVLSGEKNDSNRIQYVLESQATHIFRFVSDIKDQELISHIDSRGQGVICYFMYHGSDLEATFSQSPFIDDLKRRNQRIRDYFFEHKDEIMEFRSFARYLEDESECFLPETVENLRHSGDY